MLSNGMHDLGFEYINLGTCFNTPRLIVDRFLDQLWALDVRFTLVP